MSNRALLALALVATAVACGRLGALKTERFACNTAGDCADGYECTNGECQLPASGGGGGGDDAGGGTGGGGEPDAGADAGLPDAGPPLRDAGVTCTSTAQCLAGLTCVDGVCCTTACDAPCDRCNDPASLGSCTLRPPGSVVSSCGLYACDGVNTSCPTACDEDAGINTCVPVAQCDEVTCLPCWSGVRDSFDAGTGWVLAPLPATQYSEALIANGSLALTVQSRSNAVQFASATSVAASGLRDCGVTFQLLTAAPRTNQYAARAQLFRDSPSQLPRYGWALDSRGLVATWAQTDGGTGSQVIVTGAFTGWLRVEELAGEVRWRTAPPPGGSTFTTVHTLPHDGDLANLKLRFEASYPEQTGVNDRTTLQVDNLNLGP